MGVGESDVCSIWDTAATTHFKTSDFMTWLVLECFEDISIFFCCKLWTTWGRHDRTSQDSLTKGMVALQYNALLVESF